MIVRVEIEHEGVVTYRGTYASVQSAIVALDPMTRVEIARRARLARKSTPPRPIRALDLSDVENEVTHVDGVPIPVYDAGRADTQPFGSR